MSCVPCSYLVLSCAGFCRVGLLLSWPFVEPCREASPFRSIDFSPSGLLLSCVPWSYIVLSCAGFCRFGLLLSWLLLSSSSVVFSCRVPCCLVFSSLGPSVLSLGASWKPLRRLWGDLLGLREPSGGLLGPIVALLTGLGASWVIPGPVPGRPWEAPRPLLAALGPLLGRPGALLAAPGRPPGRSWRLPGGSWSPLGGSKVAFCRKAEIRRQYSVFHSFLGVREASWHLLGLSWSPLGGPWSPPGGSWAGLRGLGWLLGGSWQA